MNLKKYDKGNQFSMCNKVNIVTDLSVNSATEIFKILCVAFYPGSTVKHNCFQNPETNLMFVKILAVVKI